MTLPRIIFCTAVSVATLAVILLALISPAVHRRAQKNQIKPGLALSLYIQHSQHHPNPNGHAIPRTHGAYVFHHTLTEGPYNTSRVVGSAQGFIIPIENFAKSAFNIIYLTFNMPEYSGSLSIQAKHMQHKAREKLTVVGGTGSFAFARGLAVFRQSRLSSDVSAMYHVKLRLQFSNRDQTIPR